MQLPILSDHPTTSLARQITVLAILMFTCLGCEKYETPEHPETADRATIEVKGTADAPVRSLAKDENSQPESQPTAKGDTSTDSNESASTDDELPTLAETLAANERSANEESESENEVETHTIDIPDTWKRLSPEKEIWVDKEKKQVIAGGNICLNAGPLEVFVCPRHTKEHEAIISINAMADQVHAALLWIGAEPGKPVQWVPDYKPASGDAITVQVMWKNENELVTRRGQEMILNVKTKEIMQYDWVFGGSIVETIEATEETPERSFYLANSGELVCLSNFSTATLDVPIKSSDANAGLLYEANTPKIPAVGTKVYVVFSKKK